MKKIAIIMLTVIGLIGFIFSLNDLNSGSGIGGGLALLASAVAFIGVAYFS